MSDGPFEDIQTIQLEAAEDHCPKRSSDTACNIINQFPYEVLAHVFQYYVDEDQNSACPKGAFPLGAVCTAWRDIAWTTSTLWTVLHCRLRYATIETQVQLAIAWIERSGCRPLSITVFGEVRELRNLSWKSESKHNFILSLFAAISTSFARCRHLRMIGFSDIWFFTLKPLEGPSILDTLCLDAWSHSNYIYYKTMSLNLNLGTAAPTHINVRGLRISDLVIKWNNLTSFSASDMHCSEVVQVLQLAPQLAECSLSSSDHHGLRQPSPNIHPGHVIHTNLAVLNIKISKSFWSPDEYFSYMTLPRLTTCNIATSFNLCTFHFFRFLSRSRCPIKAFSFTDGTVSADHLRRIATLLPSITTLTITKNVYAEYLGKRAPRWPIVEFYRELCLDSRYRRYSPAPFEDTILLPNLKSLDISTDFPFPWKFLPGLRYLRQYDIGGVDTCMSSLVGRPDLNKISIWRSCGRSKRRRIRSNLISNWETYAELMELRADGVQLELQVERREQEGQGVDLFLSSCDWLEKKTGEGPGYNTNGYAYYLDSFQYCE